MIKAIILLITFSLFCHNFLTTAQQPVEVKAGNCKIIPNTLILKINRQNRHKFNKDGILNERMQHFSETIQISSLKKKFPFHTPPETDHNERGENLVDLSLIYELKYDSDLPVNKIAYFIQSDPAVEYCVPVSIQELLYDPDDPNTGSQYYLNSVNAFAAWDIHTGDTNVVIGITDTGVDIDHEDLAGNIKYNYDDPVNGIDDDNDGFTDNFRGWDMGDYDNNPQADVNDHGVWVSGLAAASTDNATGIAGTGFDCRFLPVKISNQDDMINTGYEGIVYAADHGCNIINCSWGGKVYSPFEQDIINYATFNRNALVIAAAGNDGAEINMYPACYENVLSIAGTNASDHLAGGSSYGIYTDICAPATSTYTTGNDNTYYTPYFGTSFSCPIAAGCAGIVRSYFPELSALQAGEKLRSTAYLLDTIPANTGYAGLLGSGRIDLYKALTETSMPSVRFEDVVFTDDDDDLFLADDIVYIKGIFKNYLATTSALYTTLSSSSPYISITGSSDYIGTLTMMGETDNYNDPFELNILSSVPWDQTIRLRLDLVDGEDYSAFQMMEFTANASYMDIDTNNITATITSEGRIGYNDSPYLYGNGFLFENGTTMLYEGGLMVGASIDQVSDCVRGEDDFCIISRAQKTPVPAISDMEITCTYNDENSGYPMGVEILQKTYAWDTEDNKDFIFIEYNIVNTSDETLEDIHAGIFADWDVMEFTLNRISYDEERRLSYCYYTGNGSCYAGMKLLSSEMINHFAIDNISGGGPNGFDITNGFSTMEKWQSLSSSWHTAGTEGSGNDIADVISSGPYTLFAGDTATILFALLAGESLYDLQNSADAAQELYDSLFTGIPALHSVSGGYNINIFPNPANYELKITAKISQRSEADVNITDNSGDLVMVIERNTLMQGKYKYNIDISSFSGGIYYVNLKTPDTVISKKLIITR